MEPVLKPILLSQPRATAQDVAHVVGAIESGWIAPIGPDLDAFEVQVASYVGADYAVGLSSGTAALHLALRYIGVQESDVVIIPTLTFAATAFAVSYLGAEPVFCDVEPEGWGLDPAALCDSIKGLRKRGKRVKAVIPVDLYGTPANYTELLPVLDSLEILIVEDAAEGLGASSGGSKLGSFGSAAAISFNGNKIITTSGGGMLVTNDGDMAARVRKWSTQSREDAPWYEHSEIGYNYRLSNLLAALGRSQMARIDEEVEKRRQIREWYRERLADLAGVSVQQDPSWGKSNAWLSVVRFDEIAFPDAPRRVREFLALNEIESRPVWKPMHLQPVFRGSQALLTGEAERIFQTCLCLPSGTSLTHDDVDRICSLVLQALLTP